jgi:hypothetical protein
VAAADRAGLERLCRYGLRVPFSQQRLSVLPDGRVRYELPRPWPTPGDLTHLDLEPVAFLKRLEALLPAPYQRSVAKLQLAAGFLQKQRAREARAVNLVRYHGVFARSVAKRAARCKFSTETTSTRSVRSSPVAVSGPAARAAAAVRGR